MKAYLSIFIAAILSPAAAWGNGGVTLNHGTSQSIDAHGTCQKILNNSSKTIFVPIKTQAEWASFLGSMPPNISAGSCFENWTAISKPENGYGTWTWCALDQDGAPYCWGSNSQGQIGSGAQTKQSSPYKIETSVRFTRIYTALHHVCGLTADGQAYCWGLNAYKQLGTGNDQNAPYPTPVAGNYKFKELFLSSWNTCGIRNDNKLMCWGRNYNGSLGVGDTNDRNAPTLVVNGADFKFVYLGSTRMCGIKISGKAYCWGWNVDGGLATGDKVDRLVPTEISGGHIFSELAISGANASSCGLKSNGSVVCWGRMILGFGYDDVFVNTLTPQAIAVPSSWKFSRLMFDGTFCALRDNNEIYCWGTNQFGGRGDGTTNKTFNPTLAASGQKFIKQISATCAVRVGDNKIMCWGNNSYNRFVFNSYLPGSIFNQPTPTPRVAFGGMTYSDSQVWSEGNIGYASCIKMSGTQIKCGGRGSLGSLGDGTLQEFVVAPVAIKNPD